MAKRPEPLPELLSSATTIVVGSVVRVLKIGPQPPPPPGARTLPHGATSVGWVSASETVRIKVDRVLRGEVTVGQELVAEKPVAPYALKVGDTGPFLLDAKSTILGRYGPDSHPLAKIEAAL